MPIRSPYPPDCCCKGNHSMLSTKYFLLSVLFLFSFQLSFSARSISSESKDTLPEMKNYKLSKQQFLDAYGKDDSSRALINFYFQQRKEAGLGTIVALALATVSLIIANNPTTAGSVYDIPGYDYLLFLLSVPLTVYGFVRWTSLSRKKLLRLLKDYYDGKSIPDRIIKKKEFNDLLTKKIDPFH